MGDTAAKQQAFQSQETMATVIHAILRQKYGEEFYMWDPLTVYLEVQADFGVDMSSESNDRLAAIQTIMTSDAFFKRLDAFMAVCNTLNDGEPFFSVFDPVTVEEAAWAITEVSLNRELLPFSYPIQQYLKIMLKKDGYTGDYPDVFDEVFKKRPDTLAIREDLTNDTVLEEYVQEQLKDLTYQFNQIDSLDELDNLILERQKDEYVSTLVDEQEEY